MKKFRMKLKKYVKQLEKFSFLNGGTLYESLIGIGGLILGILLTEVLRRNEQEK